MRCVFRKCVVISVVFNIMNTERATHKQLMTSPKNLNFFISKIKIKLWYIKRHNCGLCNSYDCGILISPFRLLLSLSAIFFSILISCKKRLGLVRQCQTQNV